MRSFWISVVTTLLIQCTTLALTSPVVAVTNPTVEYLDNSVATEVVFDETGMDGMGSESIDENIGTTELPDDTTASDDEPQSTSSPCGDENKTGPGCISALNAIEIKTEEKILKTDEGTASSDKDEGTTISPKET